MADLLEKYFSENSKEAVVFYLKLYVKNYLLLDTVDRLSVNLTLRFYSNELIKTEERIRALDPNYIPLINNTGMSQNKHNTIQNSESSGTYAKVGAIIGGIIGAIIGVILTKWGIAIDPTIIALAVVIFCVGLTSAGAMIGYRIGYAIKKK